MALAVYTGQVGRYRGVDGLDVTLKSSRGIGRAFAPSQWDMVRGVKRGTVSEAQYREWYLDVLRASFRTRQAAWQHVLQQPQVVLLCYCRPGEFCHRQILAEVLGKLGAEVKGEMEGGRARAPAARSIGPFAGPYRFLSNFFPVQIRFEGMSYPSVEHAFQAAKTTHPDERQRVRACPTAADAKLLGRKVHVRPDWETIKLGVMEHLLRQKFTTHGGLRQQLKATRPHPLVEENTWGDTFWGVCKGQGENHLGRLLMRIRDELI
jgi:ribA/ribD-fused uncharacterized protein